MSRPGGRGGPVSVVLPLRSAVDGKRRLAGFLDAALRGALIRAMCRDVVDTLRAAEVDHILVAAGDEEATAFAASLGLESFADPPRGSGLNDAVRAAIQRVPRDRTLLVMMPDLPLAKPEDVLSVALAPTDVTLVTTVDSGTGVLAFRPGVRIAPAYGERSGERHLARSAAAGVSCARLPIRRLSLDVDTVADLQTLLESRDLGRAVSALGPRLLSALDAIPPPLVVAAAPPVRGRANHSVFECR